MIVLILGGANSGKSHLAERLAAGLAAPITYVATWPIEGNDTEMAARIAVHRARRPPSWTTVELAGDDLVSVASTTPGALLVDSLGPWVAGAQRFAVDIDGLCSALAQRSGDAVIVSDEVGLGVHPSSEAGRAFREALGPVNAAVAAVADQAWLVVAGRLVALERAPW